MTIAGNPSTGLGTPPRHLPNPLPAIRPLPEYAAEGELAALMAEALPVEPGGKLATRWGTLKVR